MKPEDDEPALADAMEEHRIRQEFGIQTHTIGTWLPEGTYRPVPVVWLGGALFLQMIQLSVLSAMLHSKAAIFTAVTTGLLTFVIGRWTFARGMARAGFFWTGLTVTVLAGSWALVAAFALASQ